MLCKVRSKLSQEIAGEMAPCSGLSWPHWEDRKRHYGTHPNKCHSRFQAWKWNDVCFQHLCPDQQRMWVQAWGSDIMKQSPCVLPGFDLVLKTTRGPGLLSLKEAYCHRRILCLLAHKWISAELVFCGWMSFILWSVDPHMSWHTCRSKYIFRRWSSPSTCFEVALHLFSVCQTSWATGFLGLCCLHFPPPRRSAITDNIH